MRKLRKTKSRIFIVAGINQVFCYGVSAGFMQMKLQKNIAHRSTWTRISGISLGCALLMFSGIALGQNFTLVTYYPAPHGVYRVLRLSPNDGRQPGAACTEPGSLYYDNSDDQVYVCSGGAGASAWRTLAGSDLWTQPQGTTRLHANETNWNVGIGTINPTSKLHVAGDLTVQNGQGIVLGGVRKTRWPGLNDQAFFVNTDVVGNPARRPINPAKFSEGNCPPGRFACGVGIYHSENSENEDAFRVLFCCE